VRPDVLHSLVLTLVFTNVPEQSYHINAQKGGTNWQLTRQRESGEAEAWFFDVLYTQFSIWCSGTRKSELQDRKSAIERVYFGDRARNKASQLRNFRGRHKTSDIGAVVKPAHSFLFAFHLWLSIVLLICLSLPLYFQCSMAEADPAF
jgi:hypothetical protein